MLELNYEIIETCHKKVKAFMKRNDIRSAKNLISELKSIYPEEYILDAYTQYLDAQISVEYKVIDWDLEKTKIQDKIDNFNKKDL